MKGYAIRWVQRFIAVFLYKEHNSIYRRQPLKCHTIYKHIKILFCRIVGQIDKWSFIFNKVSKKQKGKKKEKKIWKDWK